MIERILARIESLGWSISEFERRIGATNGTVNGWRKRDSVPAKKQKQIAEVLGTTEAYLRGETDNPAPKLIDVADDDFNFAFFSETQDMSEAEKAEVLAYIRFRKSLRGK